MSDQEHEAIEGPYIRLWLGNLALRIDAMRLLDKIDEKLPAFVKSGAGLEPPEQAIRLTAKQLARGACWLINRQLDKEQSNFPRATPAKGADVLTYTVRYILSLFLFYLAQDDWTATYVESTHDGAPAIDITDLAPAATVAGAGAAPVAEAEYAQLAAPATVAGAGDADPACVPDADGAGAPLGEQLGAPVAGGVATA